MGAPMQAAFFTHEMKPPATPDVQCHIMLFSGADTIGPPLHPFSGISSVR